MPSNAAIFNDCRACGVRRFAVLGRWAGLLRELPMASRFAAFVGAPAT